MRKLFNYTFGFIVFIVLTFAVSIDRGGAVQSAGSFPVNDSTIEVDLLLVGDIMQHMPQINAAWDSEKNTYNYEGCFQYVKDQISRADIAIGNLETTLSGGPYSGYPAFSAPDQLAYDLKKIGFDMLITANNHCLDKRKKGLERTIDILDSIQMFHTGTFKDSSFKNLNYPFLYLHNGIRFVFLNYTYSTNGIEATEPNIVNYIDKKQIIRDLKKAKELKADFIVVMPHWGTEYQRTQNSEQEDIARLCFENGADLVVGSHPHVVQPIQKIKYRQDGKEKEGVVVYSLGNFVSNQRNRYKNGGIMTNFRIQKNRITHTTKLIDYSYTPAWVYKQELPQDTNFILLTAKMYDNNILPQSISTNEKEEFKIFLDDTRDLLGNVKERKE